MRVYCCQLDIAWEDSATNHRTVHAMLTADRPVPGSLVLLPEMFASGFSMNVAAATDEPLLTTHAFLKKTATEFGIYLMGGVVTGSVDSLGHNEAVVYDPRGTEVSRYRKLHPFSFAGETNYYRPGETLAQFNWGLTAVAPFICYDLRFPEAFRMAARGGAILMTVIANWPFARESHWLALLRARAIENQAYVVGVNRVGSDPNATYGGRSQIIDPRGEVLADAGTDARMIHAEIDVPALVAYRQQFPALNDMRADLMP